MSDNSYQGAPAGADSHEAPASAPDLEVTATSDVADNGEPGGDEQPQEPKLLTQEEVNAIVAKEKAKAERKTEQRIRAELEQAQRPANQPAPTREQFNSDAEYMDALVDHKADQKVMQREQQNQQVQVQSTFEARVDDAKTTKYPDYDEVVDRHPNNGGPAISALMGEAIKESDHGPDIAYYLGKNPAESHRIWGLSPIAQIREIGKIEAKLIENPPAKKVSSAPDPIKPVAGSRGTTPKVDVTDPRSDKAMSDAEWITQRNKTATS